MAKTQTYQHAIGGLLQRRAEMLEEMALARERLAVLSNDLDSLDRTLEGLGYAGDVKLTPRVPRVVLFYRGELRHFLRDQLEKNGPMTTRKMAENLIQIEGKDARDRRMMADIVRRMGKALRQMQDAKIVSRTAHKIKGEFIWRVVASSPSTVAR
ncbi:MAG TPA: hypothetical protein PKB01_07255 [Xanthobacteraceae bacterium]|nr:hypothetical protein [Xanthobacteraceae bacterium]